MKHPTYFVLIALFASCGHSYFYEGSQDIASSGWHMDEAAIFEFSTQDTSSFVDFYLDLRNTDAYPYQNIYTFIEMQFPNERFLRDTVLYEYLATDEGKWTGSGIGSTYDSSIKYKHRKKLPLPGDYRIRVYHAMRDSILVGVERVGIHIEASRD